jgi:hypothetical protein
MKTIDERIQVVIDALSAIAASPEDKQYINYHFVLAIDEVFDNEPLDWIPALVTDGALSENIANAINLLYQEINDFTKNMTTEEEDKFIKNNGHPLPAWSSRALEILTAMGRKPNSSFNRDALKRAP